MKSPISYFYAFLIVGFFTLMTACKDEEPKPTDNTDVAVPTITSINYKVTKYYTHDTSLYTEGLIFHEGKLFESTGSPDYIPSAKSMIGISNLETGKFEKKIEIDRTKYFGEGIVFLNNKLYQLTYTTHVGFIYDAKSFKKIGTFSFGNKEGWALTTDGKQLIMSDGTNTLTYLDPDSLKPMKTLQVAKNGVAVDQLNELEFINGYIFANVFMTDQIVKIDPASGNVVGVLDLSSLTYEAKAKYREAEVLNGIAFDSTTNSVFVTGKQWPTIYQIELMN
jgi:glutamine cyclotransferase